MTIEERKRQIDQYTAGYQAVTAALADFPATQLTAHPLPGKWSAAEIVQHLADSEMNSAIRLRKLLTEENPQIQGYDQDYYATRLAYNERDLAPALDSLKSSRATTAQLLARMTDADWERAGTHSESGRYTATDWLRIYAAHAHGHAEQIRRLRAALPDAPPGWPGRPAADEYAPYFEKYVALVPADGIVATLREQASATAALLLGASSAQAEFRYAPGKWSLKESFGHLIDTERIFAYRALRIGRGDTTPLPSFDENLYVAHADVTVRTLADLVEEFAQVRAATVQLFRYFDEAAWQRRGTASEREISVRAIAYIIAGHELHHRALFRDRYLVESQSAA